MSSGAVLKMTVLGVNMAIAAKKLPYQEIVYIGRGEEATMGLFPKTKRAAKRAA